jgi:hypothetical protein
MYVCVHAHAGRRPASNLRGMKRMTRSKHMALDIEVMFAFFGLFSFPTLYFTLQPVFQNTPTKPSPYLTSAPAASRSSPSTTSSSRRPSSFSPPPPPLRIPTPIPLNRDGKPCPSPPPNPPQRRQRLPTEEQPLHRPPHPFVMPRRREQAHLRPPSSSTSSSSSSHFPPPPALPPSLETPPANPSATPYHHHYHHPQPPRPQMA